MNKNAYVEQDFIERFSKTDTYQQLIADYDAVTFDKNFIFDDVPSPRQHFGDKKKQTKFSAVPFYYLEFLTKHKPKEIYDLGCGWNIFKKYIPNIIGVNPIFGNNKFNFFADIEGIVNDLYIAEHQNYFESVFSINALHFRPLSNVKNIIEGFYSMVKLGGTGFLALNTGRMIERDSEKFGHLSNIEINEFVIEEIKSTNIDFDVIDLTIIDTKDDGMDGNIRLVFTR